MLKQILKQLWTQRRANGWILLELVVISIVIWWVVDPLFVIRSNQSIPQGFDCSDVYRLTLGELPKKSPLYKAEESDSVNAITNFNRIVDRVKQYPGVEAVAVTNNCYPWSGGSTMDSYYHDSVEVNIQNMYYLNIGNYFQVFRYTSATDHRWQTLAKVETKANDIFITRDAEKKLCGNKSALGITLTGDDSVKYTVARVIDNVKIISSEPPHRVALLPQTKLDPEWLPNTIQIFFRMRERTQENPFLSTFKKQMFSELHAGNYYVEQITPYSKIRQDYEYSHGVTNLIRLKMGLAIFFLINMLFGVIGTFWLKCGARRGEIGLRMAMGSTRNGLRRLFIAEGWLLTTFATIIGLIIVFQFVYVNGFYQSDVNSTTGALWVNNAALHFLSVSGIVYLLLLITVTIGTWFPVSNASKISPVDALRDE